MGAIIKQWCFGYLKAESTFADFPCFQRLQCYLLLARRKRAKENTFNNGFTYSYIQTYTQLLTSLEEQ